jgi:hypothetical protein
MNKHTLIATLDSKKLSLFGALTDTNTALENAYLTLPDSHVHDINAAIDIYHNTLINQLINTIEKEWTDADVPNVH